MDQLHVRTAPKAIPLMLDWLENLEERIPGPETRHRELIRGWLIQRLNDSAARGDRRALDIVTALVERTDPPLTSMSDGAAGQVIARIATNAASTRRAPTRTSAPGY